jgi:hypothetical protein
MRNAERIKRFASYEQQKAAFRLIGRHFVGYDDPQVPTDELFAMVLNQSPSPDSLSGSLEDLLTIDRATGYVGPDQVAISELILAEADYSDFPDKERIIHLLVLAHKVIVLNVRRPSASSREPWSTTGDIH